MNENTQSPVVTIFSVISIVFGIIGMLGSFIPCFGIFALIVAIPATISGAIAIYVAKKKNTAMTFAIAATVIAGIGLAISGFQLFAMAGASASMSKSMIEAAEKNRAHSDSSQK